MTEELENGIPIRERLKVCREQKEDLKKEIAELRLNSNLMRHQVDYALDQENPESELISLMMRWNKEGWNKCEEGHNLCVVCESEYNELLDDNKKQKQEIIERIEKLDFSNVIRQKIAACVIEEEIKNMILEILKE